MVTNGVIDEITVAVIVATMITGRTTGGIIIEGTSIKVWRTDTSTNSDVIYFITVEFLLDGT